MSPVVVKEEISIKVGDTVPEGAFKYVPYSAGLADHVSVLSNFFSLQVTHTSVPLACLRHS